ncbi:hypothetical protein PAMA_002195 [Pampus argenteus]
MQTCQLVTLTLEVSGCVFSKLCLGELAVNAMPVSSAGDVCVVSRLSCYVSDRFHVNGTVIHIMWVLRQLSGLSCHDNLRAWLMAGLQAETKLSSNEPGVCPPDLRGAATTNKTHKDPRPCLAVVASEKRQGTYWEQMIFIGLKRSGWPAGLVATAGVMLHYDLKMTWDATAPEREREEEEEEEEEMQAWKAEEWRLLC